jgi:hypothetical protein
MDENLYELKQSLQELEKHAKETASFLVSYEENIYLDLVKQHTDKCLKEINIALSFLSLTDN